MKIISKVLLVLSLVAMPFLAKAAAPIPVYVVGLQLGTADLTETAVLISSTSNTGAILAANTDRIAFDVQVTTCVVSAPKVWYSFDTTGVSTITTSATNIIDMATGNFADRFVVQPANVVHTGPVYMRAEQTGCYAIAREWVTTSPVLR